MAYVQEVIGVLWPQATPVATRTPRPGGPSWWLLPNAERVRLVVPQPRAAAAATLRAEARNRGGRSGKVLAIAATAARVGLAHVPGLARVHLEAAGPGVELELEKVFGEPVLVAWGVGPQRANRKPVLRVLARDGRTLGYAKVGINPLTNSLVRAEADNLRVLAGRHLPSIRIPTVVGEFSIGESPVLVLAPVDALGAHPLDTADPTDRSQHMLAAALQELAGTGVTAALRDSSWAQRLMRRAEVLRDDPAAPQLRTLVARVAALPTPVRFGPWHGDCNPGNVAVNEHTVIWDWERYETDAPIGFDAQHLALQSAITQRGLPPRQAAEWAIASAPDRLAGWGLDEESARSIAALHLLDICVRYVEDQQREAGADLGAVEAWALPVLDDQLDRWNDAMEGNNAG